MANLQVEGRIIVIYQTVVVSDKFKKREFVIEAEEDVNGQTYKNYAKFQVAQQRCDVLDRYNVGDMVSVSFNLKGNSYTDKKDGTTKYITNLDAWKIEHAAGQAQQSAQPTPPAFSDQDIPF
jgi:ribosomal protein S17